MYLEFFWSVFSMNAGNGGSEKLEYGHFSRSVSYQKNHNFIACMQVNIFVDSLWYKKMRNNYFSQTRMGSSSTPLYYLHELHSNFSCGVLSQSLFWCDIYETRGKNRVRTKWNPLLITYFFDSAYITNISSYTMDKPMYLSCDKVFSRMKIYRKNVGAIY